MYTEKAHFSTANLYSRVHVWVGILATVAAAVAAATVVGKASPVVAALASAVNTFLKPQDAELKHLATGRQLGALRVRLRQAIALDLDPNGALPPAELRGIASTFVAEKAKIGADSPGTSNRAFRAARKKIDAGHFAHTN